MSRADRLTPAGIFRRVIMAPLVVAATFLLLATIPVSILIITALSPLVPGRLRPLRIFSIALLHLILESVLLLSMFGLWLAAGFGRRITDPYFERIHYDLLRGYLVLFTREARRVLGLRIMTVGPSPAAFPGEPLLVFSRHAGPGDSFILVFALLHWYGREPRIVLKDSMAWDPAIDILLHRVPNSFIHPSPGSSSNVDEKIKELASDLDANDAFVIFPEGGNFTPQRRDRAIERLRKLGLNAMADRAETMQHVLAPRPGGVLSALEAAPDADVMLVAHTGLDHMLTTGDVWRELPMDKELIMRWWRVPRAEIPESREERIEWLYDWWERIDRWVADHRPVDLTPGSRSAQTSDP